MHAHTIDSAQKTYKPLSERRFIFRYRVPAHAAFPRPPWAVLRSSQRPEKSFEGRGYTSKRRGAFSPDCSGTSSSTSSGSGDATCEMGNGEDWAVIVYARNVLSNYSLHDICKTRFLKNRVTTHLGGTSIVGLDTAAVLWGAPPWVVISRVHWHSARPCLGGGLEDLLAMVVWSREQRRKDGDMTSDSPRASYHPSCLSLLRGCDFFGGMVLCASDIDTLATGRTAWAGLS